MTAPVEAHPADSSPRRVLVALAVFAAVITALYALLFQREPNLDPADISREVSFFFAFLLFYIYASRLDVPLLHVAFLVLLTSLWMEVVDEFTFEPRWVGTGIPGPIGVAGLILLAVATRQYTIRRRLREVAHRQAEEDLRRSHSTLLAVVEGTPDAVWVKDLEGRYLLANTAFARLVGLGASAIVGRRESELLPKDVAAQAERSDHRALETGETVRFEDTVAIGGPPRTFLISKTVFRDVMGSPVGILAVARDITDRKAAEDRLAHQALHDPLTALPNRTAFTQRLERALQRWQHQPERPFAVLFTDVDRFKDINDRHGHTVGDELLLACGDRIAHLLRPGDMVARIGGDEFTALLEGLESPEEATQVAHRVLEGLRTGFDLSVGRVVATASIGVAVSAPTLGAAELLKVADEAMYRAKEQGRDRVVVHGA